jgi:hypothetical protein
MTIEQEHDRGRPLQIRDQAQEVGEKNDAPHRARDPLALAGVTVQAVDQIGAHAAHEIEEAAHQLQDEAAAIALKLRELANAMREHSRIASEHVEDFCGRATTVIEGVRALQERLDAGESKKGNGSGE